MTTLRHRKIARILFDEQHSESWTIDFEKAREMQPETPANSCYSTAATLLDERDFEVGRNISQELTGDTLRDCDVLVLLHPCDRKWEATTSENPPVFSPAELDAIRAFVAEGGGLIVVSEYEHDKYGSNLNDLLVDFGLKFSSATVVDRVECRHPAQPFHIFADIAATRESTPLLYQVRQACFYRSGVCNVTGGAEAALVTSAHARPPRAPLIAVATAGKGRVVAVCDSDLFGDEFIGDFGHRQLWLNLVYWAGAHAFSEGAALDSGSKHAGTEQWAEAKDCIDALRRFQRPDGSIDPDAIEPSALNALADRTLHALESLPEVFPRQSEYLATVVEDFRAWRNDGFGKPDFGASLQAFNPQDMREDGLEYCAVFPLYTPNASQDTRFEALLMRMPWPDWLAEIERTVHPNDKFVPGELIDYTAGYASECAVLFPETISLTGKGSNNFGIIFCDREAKRYQACVTRACEIVKLLIPPQLDCFLRSAAMIRETYALWDLIHDRSHALGDLPFDPFMIRQKMPFWMYGLEELRVDLTSVKAATELARGIYPPAANVTFAVLFDRIFRFPITGTRVRNYDGLGGQLLFSFLHQKHIILWRNNKLVIDWDALPDGLEELRGEIEDLYRRGADQSKVAYWLSAHDLVARYLAPNVASKWSRANRQITDESDPRSLVALVHDDEFPLGMFHLNLQKRMRQAA